MTPERWSRLSEIYHAALDLPPEARAGFVARACGDDAGMRTEIERMLAANVESGLLDRPLASPANAPAPVFPPGQVVAGRFRIVRFVSRGGMGEVYQALDLELREAVALKTLLPAIAGDSSMVARFKQEIQLSRKIAHPNVCRVFDLSRHPADGSGTDVTYFLTMEFLAGETLAARLQRDGPFPPEAALDLLDQMAAALDAAHAAGVIHRDFKPSNVILSPASGGLRAVVTDFGLARSFAAGTTATLSSRLMGTFDYMAPELFAGGSATVASDLYAFGLVACEMLTGALPAADPASPGARLPAPSLAPAHRRAILRALDPRPSARFASASELVAALRGHTAPSIRVSLPPLSRRSAAMAVGALLLVVGAAVGALLWNRYRNQPSPQAEAVYRKGVEQIHGGAYFAATRSLDQALRLASHFAMAHVRLADAWLELQIPERAKTEMLAARREDLSTLSGRDRLQLDAIDLTISRDFGGAVAKYEQLRRDPPAGLDVDLGRAYERAFRTNDAIAAYRRAAEGPAHNPAAWLRLAVLYSRTGKSEEAAAAFQRAEEGYRSDNSAEGLVEVAYQRGVDDDRNGRYVEGAAQLQHALESARLSGSLQQEINADLDLAVNAFATGNSQASEHYASGALAIAQANQMEAMAIRGLVALGNACVPKRDFASAEKYYRQGLDSARRNSAFRLAAYCQFSLATLYNQTSRPDDMLREAREALQFYENNGYALETYSCLILLGRYYRDRGEFTAAQDAFERAAAAAAKAANPAGSAQAQSSIGSLLVAQERLPEALDHYRKSLELAPNDESKGYAGLQCGDVLWQLGRFADAAAMLDVAWAKAARFEALKVRIERARAEMALSRGQAAQAAEIARKTLASLAPQETERAGELDRILGLAELAAGKKREGIHFCEEGLAAAMKSASITTRLSARMAVLQARLESGDRRGSLAMFHEIEPTLAGSPESRWRAYALASRVDPQYLSAAREAFKRLANLWGPQIWADYLKRTEVHNLSGPLSQADSAK